MNSWTRKTLWKTVSFRAQNTLPSSTIRVKCVKCFEAPLCQTVKVTWFQQTRLHVTSNILNVLKFQSFVALKVNPWTVSMVLQKNSSVLNICRHFNDTSVVVDNSQALSKTKHALQINKIIHYTDTSYLIGFDDLLLTVYLLYYAFNQTFVWRFKCFQNSESFCESSDSKFQKSLCCCSEDPRNVRNQPAEGNFSTSLMGLNDIRMSQWWQNLCFWVNPYQKVVYFKFILLSILK